MICKLCNKTGFVVQPPKPGVVYSENTTCPDCNGTGMLPDQVEAVAPSESPKVDGASDSSTDSASAPSQEPQN